MSRFLGKGCWERVIGKDILGLQKKKKKRCLSIWRGNGHHLRGMVEIRPRAVFLVLGDHPGSFLAPGPAVISSLVASLNMA